MLLTGCAQLMPAAKQEPFPLMEVKATRPPPGPARVVLTASNIAIMDKVQFATGKAEVAAGGLRSIDKLAEFLKKNPNRNLLIEGHTDNTGSEDFNVKLSQQRAEIYRFLSSKRTQTSVGSEVGSPSCGYCWRNPLITSTD